MIRDIYRRANISLDDIGFVEAHGTGTKVGDPIEANAIHQVFGSGKSQRSPLYIGSVKSNIGHLENVSGLASVIKATLMLEKGFIAPNVNFKTSNPAIPLREWNMEVPTRLLSWPSGKRFVSVNNFGFGGSNAHCVLEKRPYARIEQKYGTIGRAHHADPKLVVITGYDKGAVERIISQLGVYIEQRPELFEKHVLGDMAYTLGERRSHFPWRVAFAVPHCTDLAGLLNGIQATPRRADKPPKIAFAYTGQGAQWAEMGKQLLETHSVFSETLKATTAHLKSLGADFDLIEELCKDKTCSLVNQAHISQPICTAIQIGLTDLFSSWGIKPSAVIGHSSGEIGAAYATGAITMESAMEAAYYRGQAALRMKSRYSFLHGAMLAVGESSVAVKKMISSLQLNTVAIACENSPNSVTASGDAEEIDLLAAELEDRCVFNRKLRVDVAYHSSHMLRVADAYMTAMEQHSPTCPTRHSEVNFYSSLHGKKFDCPFDSSYWVNNLTNPVLFATALKDLISKESPDVIVEVGPHSALEGPIKQTLKAISSKPPSVAYVPTLIRNQNATVSVLHSAGCLFVHGAKLNFDALNHGNGSESRVPRLVNDFEPYPFTPHEYWFETRVSKQHRLKPFPRHDLLGLLDDTSSDVEPSWRNSINTNAVPWLKGHCMQTLTTFPLAGYLCMGVEAVNQRAQLRGVPPEQIDGFGFREVQVTKAFIMDDDTNYETHVTLKSYAEGTRSYSDEWDEFRVSSWAPSRGWLEHCRGLIRIEKEKPSNSVASKPVSSIRSRMDAIGGEDALCLDSFYSELENVGAGYSSVFTLRDECCLTVKEKSSGCDIFVPHTAELMPFTHETPSILSTAFMDLFFQLTFAILGAGNGKMPCLYMPSAIKTVSIKRSVPNKPGERVQVVAYTQQDSTANDGPIDFAIQACKKDYNEPVVTLNGFRMTPVTDVGEQTQPRSLCYEVQWEALPRFGTKAHLHPKSANESNGNSMNTRQIMTPGYLDGSDVVLLTADGKTDNQLLNALINLVTIKTGTEPSICSLSQAKALPTCRYICIAEVDAPLMLTLDREKFLKLKYLLMASKSMLWVTKGAYRYAEMPDRNISQGLLRTVRSELSKPAAAVDLDPSSELSPVDQANLILEALKHSLIGPEEFSEEGHPIEYEFAEEDGHLVVPRIVKQEEMNQLIHRDTASAEPYLQTWEQKDRRLKIAVGTYGALNTIYWKDEDVVPLQLDEIEIKVEATGMNFKDVVIAMGQVTSPYLGVECSGTISRVGTGVSSQFKVGDRVCAMTLGAYSTFARCKATSAAVIPDSMDFETAASVPVIYSTAYYGMVELARIERGEKILIHAASGGVGQAACQLAKWLGVEVFTTVSSVEKKELIMKEYGIPEDHIFYSRDASFAASLMEATGMVGVDVVLNSLAGDLLRESWECLAPFGRFIEIGKRDITSNTRLEMSKFEYNCSFNSVDLTLLAEKKPKVMKKTMDAVLGLLSNNTIRPVTPISVSPISDVEGALRKLQSGKTIGKIIIKHNADDKIKVSTFQSMNQDLEIHRKLTNRGKATHSTLKPEALYRDATYIIIGGTGGVGRSTARRLASRGAGHVVLLSRTGQITPEIEELQRECAPSLIHVHRCDVSSQRHVTSLLALLKEILPPIRGVIHAAMVLKDMLFESMEFEDYRTVVQSKIDGAWHFHHALSDEPPLDFFILLSSVAGIVGNRGQAGYSAANTFLDAFAQYRRRKGLKATSLDLSAVADIGYLAGKSERTEQVLKTLSGTTMVGTEVLALIDAAIDGHVDQTCNAQCITGLALDDSSNFPFYASDGKFSHLRKAALARDSNVGGGSSSTRLSIAEQIKRAADVTTAQNIIADGLRDKLSSILMIPPEVMEARQSTTSIAAFGLDSLNAIELRNWIGGLGLGVHLQVLELLTSGSLDDLAKSVLSKSRVVGSWTVSENE